MRASALVVQKLGNVHSWELAMAALERMGAQVREANVAYNTAMGHCRRAQHWQMALCMLERMSARKLADVVSFNTAISACASVEGASLRLLQWLQVERLQPDVITFASAASSCEVHALWREALDLMAQAPKPNNFLLTAVLGACGRGKRWQRALQLLLDVGEHDVQPSAVAFNAAMSACGHAKHWQIAMGLLPEMMQRRLTPNSTTFGAAVNACGRMRMWKQVLALLALMRNRTLQANSWILHGAAWACARARHWAYALELQATTILDWQVAMDLFDRRTFCNEALRALCKLGRPRLAFMLLLNAKKPQHPANLPNLLSFVAGLEASRLSASNPVLLALPLARSLNKLLNQRRGCWAFVDDALDYGGNAVLAMDFLHSVRPCTPLLQGCHGSLFRAVVADLAEPRGIRGTGQVLERQFSLGSCFTPPALNQLGLVFRRKHGQKPKHVAPK